MMTKAKAALAALTGTTALGSSSLGLLHHFEYLDLTDYIPLLEKLLPKRNPQDSNPSPQAAAAEHQNPPPASSSPSPSSGTPTGQDNQQPQVVSQPTSTGQQGQAQPSSGDSGLHGQPQAETNGPQSSVTRDSQNPTTHGSGTETQHAQVPSNPVTSTSGQTQGASDHSSLPSPGSSQPALGSQGASTG